MDESKTAILGAPLGPAEWDVEMKAREHWLSNLFRAFVSRLLPIARRR